MDNEQNTTIADTLTSPSRQASADPAINPTGNYNIELEIFSGPMDLLLYLIKKEEVDIYHIPIARITSQYLKYVQMIEKLNLEMAGEFVLMAATLIRLKTRLLLPRDEENDSEIDPREELILALVEYKKFKEAGEILRERALLEERNYVPPSPLGQIKGRVDLEPVTSLYDLMMAFKEAMAARPKVVEHEIDTEEITIEERVHAILAMMADKEFSSFHELLVEAPRKIMAVVTFIAILELARNHRIKIVQAFPFSELRVYRGQRFDQGATFLNREELTEDLETEKMNSDAPEESNFPSLNTEEADQVATNPEPAMLVSAGGEETDPEETGI